MMAKILVSVIIPTRNEGEFISRCLESILNQDYPKEKLEILVVDGLSEDKTKQTIRKYSKEFQLIKILDNEKKETSYGLNLGIRKSVGDLIIIVSAHAVYSKDYIRKCTEYIEKYDADIVGGTIKIETVESTAFAKATTETMSSFFGAGNSPFKKKVKKAKFADVTFGGGYKKEIFYKVGFFNEKLKRSQDMEFCIRVRRAGGKILIAPDMTAKYFFKKTGFFEFLKRNFIDGLWATYPLKYAENPMSMRHYIPLIFVSIIVLSGFFAVFFPLARLFFLIFLFLYVLSTIFFSVLTSVKKKNFIFLFYLPITFLMRHFGYGFGSLWGLIKLLICL